MNKLLDAALGIQPQAMTLNARRLEVLAANMANVDTPGYRARDIDFRAALDRAVAAADGAALQLRATSAGHQHADGTAGGAELRYRVPNHPSLDGNTVDSQLEQAAFAEASVRYQASLDFLESRIAGVRKALRGE